MAENTQDKAPEVSIIMNCLNGSKYLKEAIQSVYAQTFTDWEIIFWDNGSTDQSAEIAKSFDRKLKYFHSEETEILGHARNRAMREARGRYIAFLDSDDVWLPRKLELQIPLLQSNQRVGLLYSDSVFFNDQGDVRLMYGNDEYPGRGDIFRTVLGNYRMSMETVVIRREALDGLKEWFDVRFEVIQDADLFIRIAHDWECDFVAEPLSKWRMHAESLSFARKEIFPREKKLMLEKFANLYEDFHTKYQREAKILKNSIEYSFALIEWEMGRADRARKHLGPIMLEGKKYFLVYFMTFLPYPIFEWLKKKRGASPDSSAQGTTGT